MLFSYVYVSTFILYQIIHSQSIRRNSKLFLYYICGNSNPLVFNSEFSFDPPIYRFAPWKFPFALCPAVHSSSFPLHEWSIGDRVYSIGRIIINYYVSTLATPVISGERMKRAACDYSSRRFRGRRTWKVVVRSCSPMSNWYRPCAWAHATWKARNIPSWRTIHHRGSIVTCFVETDCNCKRLLNEDNEIGDWSFNGRCVLRLNPREYRTAIILSHMFIRSRRLHTKLLENNEVRINAMFV